MMKFSPPVGHANSEPKASTSRFLHPPTSTRQGLSMFDRKVLATVDEIPSGSVMTYGDIAEFLGEGTPRMVARVMSTKSDPDTAWHRVLKADGRCAAEVALRQLALLRDEGTAFTISRTGFASDRVNLKIARWNPTAHDECATGKSY